jgi:hypothetical protein
MQWFQSAWTYCMFTSDFRIAIHISKCEVCPIQITRLPIPTDPSRDS